MYSSNFFCCCCSVLICYVRALALCSTLTYSLLWYHICSLLWCGICYFPSSTLPCSDLWSLVRYDLLSLSSAVNSAFAVLCSVPAISSVLPYSLICYTLCSLVCGDVFSLFCSCSSRCSALLWSLLSSMLRSFSLRCDLCSSLWSDVFAPLLLFSLLCYTIFPAVISLWFSFLALSHSLLLRYTLKRMSDWPLYKMWYYETYLTNLIYFRFVPVIIIQWRFVLYFRNKLY